MHTTGLLPRENFSQVFLSPSFPTFFWAPKPDLHQSRGSSLFPSRRQALSWLPLLSQLSRLSITPIEVHVWSPYPWNPNLNLNFPTLQYTTGEQKNQPITAEWNQVTSLFGQQRLLVWEHTYLREGGLHKLIPQKSNVLSTMLQYMNIFIVKKN